MSDINDTEYKIIQIIRSLKPYQRVEIMADGEGRPDVYVVVEASKRMVFPNKSVFMAVKTKSGMDI